MATNEQGIMALPEGQQAAMPQLSYMDSYDAVRQGFKQARPDVDLEVQEVMDQMKVGLDQLPDEQLDALVDIVTFLYENPDQYAKEIAQAVQDGDLEAGVFPEEYDEEFLSTLLAVLIDEQRSRDMGSGMMMPPPQNFARGGIAEAARLVASQGRNGDTMLAHITPAEMRLLKSRGGSGTINPVTGLPEFWNPFKAIGKLVTGVGKAVVNTVKNVVGAVKSVLKSPIGRIVATIGLSMMLGPAVMSVFPSLGAATAAGTMGLTAAGSAVVGGLSSGLVAAAAGDNLKDVLRSAALGAFSAPGGPVSNYVGKYTGQFISNPTVQAAANAAIIGTSGGVLTGQSLKDSLKSGLTQGAIAGGVAYMQGAAPAKANADAANAAANATDDVVATLSGNFDEAQVLDDAVVQTAKGGLKKVTTLRDGRVFEQAVDAAGNKIGPATPVAAAGPATSPTSPNQINISERLSAGIDDVSSAPAVPEAIPYTTQRVADATYNAAVGATSPNQINISPRVETLASMVDDVPPRNIPYADYRVPASASVGTGGAGTATPSGVPEVGASLARAGSGVMDIAKGNFSQGYEQLKGGLGDLFFPGTPTAPAAPTSADILNSPQYKMLVDKGVSPNVALQTLKTELTPPAPPAPGAFRTYGPGVAAGVAALGMAGGFTPKPPPETEFAKDMRQPIDLSDNPSAYYIQGLPGVQYNERGEIIGSSAWSPSETMEDIRVATPSYIGYNPMAYTQPTYFNMGGIAALAQGGYPRRIGQISGPGTETSDDIPAMLSDGEFVMTARAVRGAGNGSRREGAKKMYALMHQLERNAARG
jgi:hypothetical protein